MTLPEIFLISKYQTTYQTWYARSSEREREPKSESKRAKGNRYTEKQVTLFPQIRYYKWTCSIHSYIQCTNTYVAQPFTRNEFKKKQQECEKCIRKSDEKQARKNNINTKTKNEFRIGIVTIELRHMLHWLDPYTNFSPPPLCSRNATLSPLYPLFSFIQTTCKPKYFRQQKSDTHKNCHE